VSEQLRLFFVAPELLDADEGAVVAMPEPLQRHVLAVLRLADGARIELRDERARSRVAEVVHGGSEPSLRLGPVRLLERPSGQFIVLVPALIKPKRWAWLLQKATELGADVIAPVESARCVVRWGDDPKKSERSRKILAEAARQSEGHAPPKFLAPVSLEHRVTELAASGAQLVVACPGDDSPLLRVVDGERSVAVFTGPEGGFTDAEVNWLIGQGVRPVQLGPRILRAETAPIAALAALRLRA